MLAQYATPCSGRDFCKLSILNVYSYFYRRHIPRLKAGQCASRSRGAHKIDRLWNVQRRNSQQRRYNFYILWYVMFTYYIICLLFLACVRACAPVSEMNMRSLATADWLYCWDYENARFGPIENAFSTSDQNKLILFKIELVFHCRLLYHFYLTK